MQSKEDPMTNVISLNVPQRRQTLPQRAGTLVDILPSIADMAKMFFGSKRMLNC
jgi:hypothetical protein